MALRQVKDTPTNNFATFDAAHNNGIITMSDGNLRVEVPSGNTHCHAMANYSLAPGYKWYFEFYCANASADSCGYGLLAKGNQTGPDLSSGSPSQNRQLFQDCGYPIIACEVRGGICYRYDNIDMGGVFYNGTANGGPTDTTEHSAWYTTDKAWVNKIVVFGIEVDLTGDGTHGIFNFRDDNGWTTMPFQGVLKENMGWHPGVCGYASDIWYANFGQNPDFCGTKSGGGNHSDANGQGQFYYEPPAGALALCSRNIQSVEQNGSYVQNVTSAKGNFRPVAWKPSSSGTIIPLGFNADLVWAKRTNGGDLHRLYDSIRGEHNDLIPSSANKESSYNYGLGFVNGNRRLELDAGNYFDGNGNEFVAWCWKAGGAPTSDDSTVEGSAMVDGTPHSVDSIKSSASTTPSKMSVNTTAGFSIVKYQGGSNVNTIPHGLNSAPEMIIIKNLENANGWVVGSSYLSSWAKGLGLDISNDEFDATSSFNSTAPDNNVFTLGNSSGANNSDYNYIAYCWHSVPGYSAFGGYVGNGSTDGPFVYTGFRPAFVMIKQSRPNGQTGGNSWWITDSARYEYNGDIKNSLRADTDVAENTQNSAIMPNYLSNGFKIKGNDSAVNATGSDYIYMVFAEQPGAFSNAR